MSFFKNFSGILAMILQFKIMKELNSNGEKLRKEVDKKW